MKRPAHPLIAFFGDDFTGSTDALEQLTLAGVQTVLFIDVPTPAQLDKFQGLEAFGVAGTTRALAPKEMEDVLRPAFQAIAKLNPHYVHYKVCSTFDSSPTIGSIGKALDIGAEIFKTPTVPVLVAVPKYGRYSLFGNLFARMGIGSDGQIYRLDRHPSMSRHPSTPADESDIRIHLSKQTKKQIGLFDLLQVHQFENQSFDIDFKDSEVMLFDAVKQEELSTIGRILNSMRKLDQPLFMVGSSGIEMALGTVFGHTVAPEKSKKLSQITTPVLVVSGSCSAVTAHQIENAIDFGFEAIEVDTLQLASHINEDFDSNDKYLDTVAAQYADTLLKGLRAGKSVVLHTSLGSDDPRLATTASCLEQRGLPKKVTAKLYGTLLGLAVKKVTEQIQLQRIIVAGGDTSSYAARAMGVEAVEVIASLSAGAPICLAHGKGSIDQLQVVFKGGQVGKPDFLITTLNS